MLPLLRMFGYLRFCAARLWVSISLLVVWIVLDVVSIKLIGQAIDQVNVLGQVFAQRAASQPDGGQSTQAASASQAAVASGNSPDATGAALPQAEIGDSLWTFLFSDHPQVQALLWLLLAVFAARLAYGVVQFGRSTADMQLIMSFLFHARQAVYHKLQTVGFAFHDRMTTSALINRALSDLGAVRQFVTNSCLVGLEMVARLVAWTIALGLISPWLLLAMAIPLPLWVYVLLRFSWRQIPIYQRQMQASDEVMRTLTENIEGVQVIKAFAAQPREIARYDRDTQVLYERKLESARVVQTYIPLIRIIGTITQIGMILFAAYLILLGQIPLGSIAVISVAVGQVLGQLRIIQVLSEDYQKAKVSSERMVEILDACPDPAEPPNAPDLSLTRGEVVFERVTFGYDPARPVARSVSLLAAGGRVTAVVGPTGSGKSTLLSLIGRFYDPQQGRVLIDGQDLRGVRLSSVRRSVGFVFQESFLFSQTIRENLMQGRADITQDMLDAAAEVADCAGFIRELEKGWDTVLGERGVSLSGGQRQRLSIARAIVGNPPVIVLDDALAAVDANTEQQILTLLDLVMAGRTVLVIANRLSTVQRADQVVVLEHGQVVQSGTHADLLKVPGYYRDVALAQLDAGPVQADVQSLRPAAGPQPRPAANR